MDWYYANEGQQVGPINQAEFDRLVSTGTVLPHTLVWHEGLEAWREYGRLSAGLTGTFCSFCGREYAPSEMMYYGDHFVCAQCKSVFVHRLKEGLSLPGQLNYAGFWIRAVAKVLDIVITIIVVLAIYFPLMFLIPAWEFGGNFGGLWINAISYVISFAYSTFFIGKYQATPGKMAVGIKVIVDDGGRVTYLRAFARSAAELLNSFTLDIGYIMAGFDEEKRALHDRICSTRVIRK